MSSNHQSSNLNNVACSSSNSNQSKNKLLNGQPSLAANASKLKKATAPSGASKPQVKKSASKPLDLCNTINSKPASSSNHKRTANQNGMFSASSTNIDSTNSNKITKSKSLFHLTNAASATTNKSNKKKSLQLVSNVNNNNIKLEDSSNDEDASTALALNLNNSNLEQPHGKSSINIY